MVGWVGRVVKASMNGWSGVGEGEGKGKTG